MNHLLPRLLCYVAAIGLAAVFATGCATMSEPGGPVAAVTVKASSAFAVTEAVRAVFVADQFRLAGGDDQEAVFEKEGSRYERAMYGGWDGQFPTERVRVAVVDTGAGTYRVRCFSSIVRSGAQGDDEQRRFQLHSPHYQDLLTKVQSRVK
jgi:hypothetical protein